MSKCRGCGREIIWVKMKSGKAMPVDPEPYRFAKWDDNPETFITKDGETIKGIPGIICTGYISHFATCPVAGDFRKKR